MASFTDKAPVFNPYVQQQPVEAMVKVGMAKQQQYDEGLQRIQNSYNQIAGLDIMKEGDRSYLKNKLHETTQKLRGYAAGDFSNSQLTNSVTGMINSVAKDDVVQGAVYSTQKARTELSKASIAEKDGKSSVINQWDINTQVSAWLNDGEIGSSFNGKYTQYRDVDKKLWDVYEKMDDVEKVNQNPYSVDSKGEIMFFDNKGNITTQEAGGQPRVNEVMLEQVIKGKSSNKIMKNFMSSMDEDDLVQLRLNGKYHYRETTVQSFKNEMTNQAAKLKEIYNKNIIEIGIELETNSDLTLAERKALEEGMTRLQSDLDDNTIDKKLQQQLSMLSDPKNFENYKSTIYVEKYLNEKADAMSTESIKNLIKDNPLWQARFKTKEFNFRISESIRDQKNQDIRNTIAWENLGINQDNLQMKKDALAREKDGDPLITNNTAIPTEKEDLRLSTISGNIKALDGEIQGLTNEFVNIIKLDLPADKKFQILEQKYADYKLDSRVLETDTEITPDIKEYIKERNGLENQKYSQQTIYAGAIKAGVDAGIEKKLEEAYDKIPGMYYRKDDGTPSEMTSREVYKFTELVYGATTFVPLVAGTNTSYGTSGGSGGYFELNTDELWKTVKGTEYEKLGKAIIKNDSGQDLTQEEVSMLHQYDKIKETTSKAQVNNHRQLENIHSEYIKKKTANYFDQTAVIDKEKNKKIYNDAVQLLNQKMAQINLHGAADVYKGNEFDSDNVAKLLKDKSTVIMVKKSPIGDSQLIVQNGSQQEIIPVLPNEIANYLPEVAVEHPLNAAMMAIRNSSRNSTNKALGGTDSPTEAYFTGYDLPGLMETKIAHRFRADIIGFEKNIGDPVFDKYLLTYYFNDYGTNWIKTSTNDYANIESIKTILGNTDTTTIDDMLKNANKK